MGSVVASFLEWFRGRRDRPEERAVTSLASIPKNSDGFVADAGVYVSEQTALQLTAVHACVRLLADAIASLPMDVYRKRGDLREPVRPTPPLVANPLDEVTDFEWKFMVVTSLALRGNSYNVVVERDRFEFPTKLLPVHPDVVQVSEDRDTGRPIYRVEGERIPNADMVHIKRFTLPGWLTGLSPIEAARQGIGLGLAAERFGARWFGDSAAPSSVLETDQDRTPEQVREIQRNWIASHGGRRYPAVLSGGFKWRPITITPEESQFLETRRFQRSEIAMLFGIPPHMIGDTERSTSWGTGIEQQSIGFVVYTLRPWLTCIESALSRLLPRGQFVRFNVDALLRGDIKSRYEAYAQARNAGWLSVDEIRELEDRPPLPGGIGQGYLQPLNMAPLGSDPLAQRERTPEPARPAEEGNNDEA